jgi:hypothetical protein
VFARRPSPRPSIDGVIARLAPIVRRPSSDRATGLDATATATARATRSESIARANANDWI